MRRTTLPRWTRPRPLISKAQLALAHPEMQPLGWLIERNYPRIVEARLSDWRQQQDSEKGQAFWADEFPKLLRKSLRSNLPGSTVVLWQGMPREMPLPNSTLALWILALAEDESFGQKWSTEQQQEWLKRLGNSPQNIPAAAWEALGHHSIHALERFCWSPSNQDDSQPSLAENLWKTGSKNAVRSKQLISQRLSVETLQSYNNHQMAARHIGWSLEAQSTPALRQALADHVTSHLLEHVSRYAPERDPTWATLSKLASAGCAETPAFKELFNESLSKAHRKSQHARITQALQQADFPPQLQINDRQAIEWVSATRPYWETDEIFESLKAWGALVKKGMVSPEVQRTWFTALLEQVPNAEAVLRKSLEASPRPIVAQLIHELRAHQLQARLPAADPATSKPKPRF